MFHSINILYDGTDSQTHYFTNEIFYIKSANKHNRGEPANFVIAVIREVPV